MRVVLAILLPNASVTAGLNVWARRAGYAVPGRSPVRCGEGHLFLTTWVIGCSLTRVRLGPLSRWGRCPAGHWARMLPVKDADLTVEEHASLYGGAQQ